MAGTATEAQTILDEDYEGVSKIVLAFVITFLETTLQIAKQGDRPTASQLNDFLTDTSFEIKLLKRYIKRLADRKEVFTRKKDLMNEDKLHKFW